MANLVKIGRNDACPCGSGRKFKHCCMRREQILTAQVQTEGSPTSKLKAEIARIQQAASRRDAAFRELGVFLFFSTADGDAWLLEITESDMVQVARAGEPLDLSIEEGEQTIAINWTHTFHIRDRQLWLTAYADRSETALPQAPSQQIAAAVRRIKKRYDQSLLDQVHMAAEAKPSEMSD